MLDYTSDKRVYNTSPPHNTQLRKLNIVRNKENLTPFSSFVNLRYVFTPVHDATCPYKSIQVPTSHYMSLQVPTSPYMSLHVPTSPYMSLHVVVSIAGNDIQLPPYQEPR